MKNNTTIKTIAKELNVSVSTVSRSLSNNPRIGLKTRELVLATAKRLNYVPNIASNYLKTSQTHTLGIIVPIMGEEYFSQVISGIEDVIEKKGYHAQVFQSRNDMQREVKATETFLRMRVDGVIVSLSAKTNSYLHFKRLEDFGIPVIFFDRIPRNFESHSIKCNMSNAAKRAMQLFAEKGISNVAIINGPSNLDASDQRLNSYLEGVKEFKFRSSPQLIKSCDLTPSGVENCIEELFSQEIRPQGIITFNDYVALYAMNACKKFNIIPNKDVIFIGHGNLPFTKYIDNPPIASIEQFPQKTGEMAAELFLDIIKKDQEKPAYRNLRIESILIEH